MKHHSSLFLSWVLFTFSICQPIAWADALVNRVFKQPSEVIQGSVCFEQPLPALPHSLALLSEFLDSTQPEDLDSQAIRRYFSGISKSPGNIHLEIDGLSTYYQRTQSLENPNIFSGQERPTRFCGAKPENLRLIIDEDTREFLEGLFLQIAISSDPWNRVQLSRADLFHAHIVYNQAERNVILVFHAKEYPDGEPSMTKGFPRRKLLDYFEKSLEGSLNTLGLTPDVTRRNFIWSLKNNKICGFDTTQGNFRYLAEDPSFPLTLAQSKLSDLGAKGEIANINYFPREGVPLFLDFHRGTF